MGESPSRSDFPAPRPGDFLRLGLALAVSLALSLACFDVAASILRDHPRAFHGLAGALPPLAMSIPAFFLLIFPCLLAVALVPLGAARRLRGPLMVGLGTTLGALFMLILYYNLLTPHPSSGQLRLLTLSACLSAGLGIVRFQMLRRSSAGEPIPSEVSSTLLAFPVVVGLGFLLIWGESYMKAMAEPRSFLASFALVLALAVAAVASIYGARRIRVGRWVGATALLLVLSGFVAMLPRAETAGAAKKSHALGKILFLSIDTLRADAVSALNPAAPPTKSLDSLAADSVVFTRAYSPSPWTLPTFSSMMTGVTPLVHGVRKFENRIPGQLTTLAQRMQEAGYRTAAFGDQIFLHPQQGISRGFDSYDISPREDYGGSLGARLLGWAFPARFRRQLDTTQITDLAIDWLKAHAREDFFLWLHYFKPHDPYEPLPRYRPREEPPAGMGFKFSSDNAIRGGLLVLSAEQREWVRRLYEGEIHYVDDSVGRVLDELKRLGIYDQMLIVFVSDHGEEFWDHDGRGHGHTFYDELLRVPLFFKLPAGAARSRFDELVCSGSIYPTLLELAGIPFEAASLSYASLTPLLLAGSEPYREEPVLGSMPLYFEDRQSLVFGRTKYIVSLVTHREQLYDLAVDPREQRNLAGNPSERLAEARRVLAGLEQASAALHERYKIQTETGPTPLSPETLEKLRSLGYVR
jgi:arylsulfatase A-like enzyme